MAVHCSDDAHHLAAALDSILPFAAQLRDTVLVCDGPLEAVQEDVIRSRAAALKLKPVRLPTCGGLGHALNQGLAASDSEFVLRMDADDLSRPHRLQRLLAELQRDSRIDVLGSFIAEFDNDPECPTFLRVVPLSHEEISAGMRRRCTMNHVSCLIRRQAAIDVGGYAGGRGFAEDWWLWARLLLAGKRFANVPEVLIDVRIGNGFIARRQGWSMFRQDIRLLSMMRAAGFISAPQFAALHAVKFVQRTLPAPLLKMVYQRLRSAPEDRGQRLTH